MPLTEAPGGLWIRRSGRPSSTDYMAAWKGKLKGKVVLMTRPRALTPASQVSFSRYNDKELSDRVVAPQPVARLSDVRQSRNSQ